MTQENVNPANDRKPIAKDLEAVQVCAGAIIFVLLLSMLVDCVTRALPLAFVMSFWPAIIFFAVVGTDVVRETRHKVGMETVGQIAMAIVVFGMIYAGYLYYLTRPYNVDVTQSEIETRLMRHIEDREVDNVLTSKFRIKRVAVDIANDASTVAFKAVFASPGHEPMEIIAVANGAFRVENRYAKKLFFDPTSVDIEKTVDIEKPIDPQASRIDRGGLEMAIGDLLTRPVYTEYMSNWDFTSIKTKDGNLVLSFSCSQRAIYIVATEYFLFLALCLTLLVVILRVVRTRKDDAPLAAAHS